MSEPRKQYHVWSCKIVVPIDTALPEGFDNPPRRAAVDVIASALGEESVIACFSGWGGGLNASERDFVAKHGNHAHEEKS